MQGKQAGLPIQIASAPVEAEFTGISFSSDYKTMFLSVQHPGEKSKSINQLSSHWPSGDKSQLPKPTVVTITGPSLDFLMT